MKRVIKGTIPTTLAGYIQAYPNATWGGMSNDGFKNGIKAAVDCRDQAISDQGGLCAYCERSISSDEPHHRGIEHFHSKSDVDSSRNWGLDWENMLAVCDGGSKSSKQEQWIYPLPRNLSCDAHKNHMNQKGGLPKACEGYLLNPLDIPAFPNLFTFNKSTGELMPNPIACEVVQFTDNKYESTYELISRTVEILNLNCDRLKVDRILVMRSIDKSIEILRDNEVRPSEMPEKLVSRYFNTKWPQYFTTIRCCLGSIAEDYLQSIEFAG